MDNDRVPHDMNYREGQIYTSKRNKPDSAFVIQKLYERRYEDGNVATRVKGWLITGEDACASHERDLDARSMEKMFPHLKFDPPREREETPK